jgi:Fe-S-cluster containining protein
LLLASLSEELIEKRKVLIKNDGFSYLNLAKESANLRRAGLLEAMEKLKERSVGCSSCPGTCCTFVANSMQITPLEAIDLYSFLQNKNLLNDELWTRLEENIKEFRLLSGPHVGAGRAFRRTYTCPFFAGKSLGCTISPESKPYGCLAFNPAKKLELSGKSCKSDMSELEKRENSMEPLENTPLPIEGLELADKYKGRGEIEINSLLRDDLKIGWVKESIPVALLDLRERFRQFTP